MTTVLPDIRARIAAIVAGVTPSEEPARAFETWAPRKGLPVDASGHHAFVTKLRSGGETVAHGDALAEKSAVYELRVTYSPAGLDIDAMSDAIARDASAIMLALDRGTGWPAGTQAVETQGFEVVERDNAPEVDLVITIAVDAEET